MTGPCRRVRPVDEVWLAMDQPDNLMVVEGLMVIEGDLDRRAYVELLRERVLHRFPRLHQRAHRARLPGLGHRWEDDPDFDLGRHVREVHLGPPGDDAALEAHVASYLSRALDLGRSPWEVQLIRGYEGGTVVYTRLHHALADGTALLRVIGSLADEQLAWDDDGPSGLHRLVGTGLRALPATGRLLQAPAVAAHLLLARRPASPLVGLPQHAKRVVRAPSIEVADVARLREATGATATDVVMSALAGALRRWLLAHGAESLETGVPTMVPVDLRGSAALRPDDLGNQFALVLLDLPVEVESPLGRLMATASRTAALKHSPEAWLTFGLLEGLGLVHPLLRVHATDFFARKATGVTTSVRGPDVALHLAGRPITGLWAWAPMSSDQSLSTSIVGYGGRINVGFKVDAAVIPDPELLVAGLVAELRALLALAPAP